MAIRTLLVDPISEGSTPLITAAFHDEAGAVILTLTTATVTLTDPLGAIINGRNNTSLLADGLNAITNGILAWRLTALDTAIINAASSTEVHKALIEWTWGGNRSNSHEIAMRVVNLQGVP